MIDYKVNIDINTNTRYIVELQSRIIFLYIYYNILYILNVLV